MAKTGSLVGGDDNSAANPIVVTPATVPQPAFTATAGSGWAIFNTPAAAVQATITRAAGAAGIRHACAAIAVSVGAVAAASGILQAVLRDGASGAGTILWSQVLSVPVNGGEAIALSFVPPILGTAATAMTLEFTGAPAAGAIESVSMSGFDGS